MQVGLNVFLCLTFLVIGIFIGALAMLTSNVATLAGYIAFKSECSSIAARLFSEKLLVDDREVFQAYIKSLRKKGE